jgi:predicted lysophospholipase L1 biosynthesis ABC-type transport system permease subunit
VIGRAYVTYFWTTIAAVVPVGLLAMLLGVSRNVAIWAVVAVGVSAAVLVVLSDRRRKRST